MKIHQLTNIFSELMADSYNVLDYIGHFSIMCDIIFIFICN